MSLKRPFEGARALALILPVAGDSADAIERAQIAGIRRLFTEHEHAIARELGAPIIPVTAIPPSGPRWFVGPAHLNAALASFLRPKALGPELYLDRRNGILISDGRDLEDIFETFSYLRSLARFPGGCLRIQDAVNLEDAVERLAKEVASSSPAPAYRRIDWDAVCRHYAPRVLDTAQPIAMMQQWLAELHDAHTWLRPNPALADFPYELWVEPGLARFAHVPEYSLAWRMGVRVGSILEHVDTKAWLQRTAASTHHKPLLSGRRLLETPPDHTRHFVVRNLDGKVVEWEESPPAQPWRNLVEVQRLPSGNGYLKIAAWAQGHDLEAAIDAAFSDLRRCRCLVVDLRSNTGGNLAMAQRFRNRFLRDSGVMGSIAWTYPDGRLGPHEPIYGEPAPETQRWFGEVIFLTNPLTYSASEDALLGLQGLPHVRVIGQRSGGGSGRIRVLRLLPGWRLTLSTALTYDRKGHCIEGQGIPVDVSVPFGADALALADQL